MGLERIFPGDSELARRLREFDWSATELGAPETWPANLRVALGICLSSRFPMHVWWGPNLTLFYNDAYIPFLGRKHPHVLGRSGREAWPEIWHQIGPMIERVMHDGEASCPEDIQMLFAREMANEEVYVTFSFSPIWGDGKVDGVFGACTETTADARAKDELIAVLAHELRSPLAPIAVTLETIAMTGRAEPEAIAMMQRQCAQLNRLINDLLDISRLRQGRLAINRAPIDLAAVATQGLDRITRLLEPERHDVELQLGRGAYVLGDRERLAQVVAALISNAVRFSAVGDPVVVAVCREGDRGKIEVRDRGEGMTPERVARLFDPFGQDAQPLARPKGGIGLGLALSRGIVDLHGGTLSAQSAGPGHGSVFTVELPLIAH